MDDYAEQNTPHSFSILLLVAPHPPSLFPGVPTHIFLELIAISYWIFDYTGNTTRRAVVEATWLPFLDTL